jgi:branched-subunit amino acid ABC-type transport system permease component
VPAVNTFFQYAVPGVVDGAIYALCALGLVLTYKTSGVFNFAHGAMAAAAAYAFYQFRVRNGLVIVGLIGGLLLERIAHWLASAPTVNVVVATVGILVALQSLATAVYGASAIQFADYLPTSGFHIQNVLVSGGDLIVIGLSLVTAVGLFFYFKRARMGVAMIGVVDNPSLLSLDAVNPSAVRRIAWIVGATFAGVSGCLLVPRVGLSVNELVLLVITAYGAAALGLFDSLPFTVLGGFVIGILVDYLPYWTQRSQNVTIQQLPNNVPFLVLFATLVLVPARRFKQRGVRNIRAFRPIREFRPTVMAPALLAGGIALVVLPFVVGLARVPQYSAGLGYAIIFASLGLITWTSGQISLCHIGFAAIGATTCGHALDAGVPWLLAMLLGGLVTIPAGAIVAIPAIRLSGIYVAIATFGFGILLQQIVYPSSLMFGLASNVQVPRPRMFGIDFTSDRGYYFLALFVAALCCAAIVAVRRSRLGLLLRGLSDSPVALDAHGANTNLTRVLVFCFASFLAGLGGAVIAGVPETASGSAGGPFDFTVSLVMVAVLAFCGRRPLLSPFIAAFVYEVLKTYPFFDNQTTIKYEGVAFGLLALLVAVAPGIAAPRLGRRATERDTGGGRAAERITPPQAIQPLSASARARLLSSVAVRDPLALTSGAVTSTNGVSSNGHAKGAGVVRPVGEAVR